MGGWGPVFGYNIHTCSIVSSHDERGAIKRIGPHPVSTRVGYSQILKYVLHGLSGSWSGRGGHRGDAEFVSSYIVRPVSQGARGDRRWAPIWGYLRLGSGGTGAGLSYQALLLDAASIVGLGSSGLSHQLGVKSQGAGVEQLRHRCVLLSYSRYISEKHSCRGIQICKRDRGIQQDGHGRGVEHGPGGEPPIVERQNPGGGGEGEQGGGYQGAHTQQQLTPGCLVQLMAVNAPAGLSGTVCPMETTKFTMPLVEAFGEFVDVPAAKLLVIQAEGRCPYIGKAKLGREPQVGEIEALGFVEDCATVVHHHDKVVRSAFFVHTDGTRYLHLNGSSQETHVSVAASSQAETTEALRSLSAQFTEENSEPDPNLVPVRFCWYASGTRRRKRMIESPEWESVRANYPEATRNALHSLHAYTPETIPSARLLMFHGAPGTGKTTAVRSLARTWQPWCATTYIVDPESLFSIPDYLLEVSLEGVGSGRGGRLADLLEGEDGGDEDGYPQWQLIIVEDVDELIRADAKDRTGQALGRLLNLTDGLLGQGLRTMFLLTTNERMGLVHPAISRPGRCLANIEFPPFTKVGAEAWLREHGVPERIEGDGATLAELYAKCGQSVISSEMPEVLRHGTYI